MPSAIDDVLAEMADLIRPMFARREPHETAMRYVAGLLGAASSANCWRLAEASRDDSPWRMQRLLNRARWDAGAVRDVIRSFVSHRLGHPGALVALREISVAKRGNESVAVARQYTEAARRVENCQVAVCASYISRHGHTVVDRDLYLPPPWTDDPERCRRASVPESRLIRRSKPELAADMVRRLTAVGLPIGWVCADEVFCGDSTLSAALDAAGLSYALEIPPGHQRITRFRQALMSRLAASRRPSPANGIPPETWARVPLGSSADGFEKSALVRVRAGERRPRFYLAHAPDGTPADEILRAVRARETAELDLDAVQRRIGFDRYEVRTWTAWHRHTTLAMVALGALTVQASRSRHEHISRERRELALTIP